jgi:hypothetical protein
MLGRGKVGYMTVLAAFPLAAVRFDTALRLDGLTDAQGRRRRAESRRKPLSDPGHRTGGLDLLGFDVHLRFVVPGDNGGGLVRHPVISRDEQVFLGFDSEGVVGEVFVEPEAKGRERSLGLRLLESSGGYGEGRKEKERERESLGCVQTVSARRLGDIASEGNSRCRLPLLERSL